MLALLEVLLGLAVEMLVSYLGVNLMLELESFVKVLKITVD